MIRRHADPLEPEYAVLEHAISSAVEPLEAAVVLESAGINDRVARDIFLVPDVLALADGAMAHAGPDRPVSEPIPIRTEAVDLGGPRATLSFHLRGVLYAVPALVTLTLLPAVDPVQSALVLGGLALSWAWCYGVASIAWSHLGNRDSAGARRFLRRALVGGALLAARRRDPRRVRGPDGDLHDAGHAGDGAAPRRSGRLPPRGGDPAHDRP